MNSATGADTTSVNCVLEWSGETTIETVTGLREDLLTAIAEGKDVTVGLRDVTRIDSAVLQLFVAARGTLAESGRSLYLGEMSDPVRTAVRLSGLGELVDRREAFTPAAENGRSAS